MERCGFCRGNTISAESGILQLSVHGRALPYRLTRSMTLADSRTLRLDYEVVNTGDAPFAGMWAAHPQFRVSPHTQIWLPDPVKQVMNVTDIPEVGNTRLCYDWPQATTQRGEVRHLDYVALPTEHRCRKFYVLPDHPVSWSGLRETPTGPWLHLEWDVENVPYLGSG